MNSQNVIASSWSHFSKDNNNTFLISKEMRTDSHERPYLSFFVHDSKIPVLESRTS
jgi:hypothetical protein